MADRTTVSVPCPGNLENFVRLTNEVTTPFGIGHPANTGDCKLSLGALDRAGQRMFTGVVDLPPGQSVDWYHAPAGGVVIFVECSVSCEGRGQLTYDTPNS
ncbi:hypothetical protein AB0I10_39320 [Streptomyces sp. NPDC050636]|uniref:hypothetical protein n=1 Tax=Streptomyces sp. NPDC050636 TaxID=3154510 RepID=UPI00344665E3